MIGGFCLVLLAGDRKLPPSGEFVGVCLDLDLYLALLDSHRNELFRGPLDLIGEPLDPSPAPECRAGK